MSAPLLLAGCLFSASAEDGGGTTIVAAGDIGDDSPLPAEQDDTARLIRRVDPDYVLPLGDLAYPHGEYSSYKTTFDPWWGRFKKKMRPVPGNHEAETSDRGYLRYFGPGRRNYSFDVGNWHLVGLDTGEGDAASLPFLRKDLAATQKPCLLMFLHAPLHSSGESYAGGIPEVKPLFKAFYAKHGDLVLAAHEHNYERFAKQNPKKKSDRAGYRQIVTGTGGRELRGFSTRDPNSQVRISKHGITRVVLKRSSYKADFIGVGGARDSVPETACNPG